MRNGLLRFLTCAALALTLHANAETHASPASLNVPERYAAASADRAQEVLDRNALRSAILLGALLNKYQDLGTRADVQDALRAVAAKVNTDHASLESVGRSSLFLPFILAPNVGIAGLAAWLDPNSETPIPGAGIMVGGLATLGGIYLSGVSIENKLAGEQKGEIQRMLAARLNEKHLVDTRLLEILFALKPEQAQRLHLNLVNAISKEYVNANTEESLDSRSAKEVERSMKLAVQAVYKKLPSFLKDVGVPSEEISAYEQMNRGVSALRSQKSLINPTSRLTSEDFLKSMVSVGEQISSNTSIPSEARADAQPIVEMAKGALREARFLRE